MALLNHKVSATLLAQDHRGLNTISNNVATIMTIALPLLGVFAAARISWRQGTGLAEVASCAIMYVLTFVGVEVGFHRHFAHRSFRAALPIRALLAVLGSMAMQGSLIWWAGVHRVHHAHTDREGDPHSPLEGFLHAHVGWLFRNIDPPDWRRRARDLFRDPLARKATRAYHAWGLAGFVLPAAGVALVKHSWEGCVQGLLWGGLVRVFLVNHVIWSINSVCHRFGSRPYSTKDESRNNAYLSLASLGFSWHNNHHAYPGSAINTHRWWQIDPCGWAIIGLQSLGLAWNVRTASRIRLDNKDRLECDRDTEVGESVRPKNGCGVRVLIITPAESVTKVRELGVEILALPPGELMKTPLSATGKFPATHWVCKNYFPDEVAHKISSYAVRNGTEIIVGGESSTAQVLSSRGLRRIANS
jgi:stearoyl-CoA desaturase (delta-9 desaturase)